MNTKYKVIGILTAAVLAGIILLLAGNHAAAHTRIEVPESGCYVLDIPEDTGIHVQLPKDADTHKG